MIDFHSLSTEEDPARPESILRAVEQETGIPRAFMQSNREARAIAAHLLHTMTTLPTDATGEILGVAACTVATDHKRAKDWAITKRLRAKILHGYTTVTLPAGGGRWA